jgi:hypothetical protein
MLSSSCAKRPLLTQKGSRPDQGRGLGESKRRHQTRSPKKRLPVRNRLIGDRHTRPLICPVEARGAGSDSSIGGLGPSAARIWNSGLAHAWTSLGGAWKNVVQHQEA